jgi:tRNA(adenine34) deaminase
MDIIEFSDEYFMKQALAEAEKAYEANEVPIGAVIVCDQRIVARGHNLTERLHDCTAHAEMQAFTSASDYIGGKFLNECILYVTLEPCLMCAGAAKWVRIGKIVYGARDEKQGYTSLKRDVLHPKTIVEQSEMADECGAILKKFFNERRLSK